MKVNVLTNELIVPPTTTKTSITTTDLTASRLQLINKLNNATSAPSFPFKRDPLPTRTPDHHLGDIPNATHKSAGGGAPPQPSSSFLQQQQQQQQYLHQNWFDKGLAMGYMTNGGRGAILTSDALSRKSLSRTTAMLESTSSLVSVAGTGGFIPDTTLDIPLLVHEKY